MSVYHGKDNKKPSGGKRLPKAKKKSYQLGREYVPVHLAAEKRVQVRTKGGGSKVKLYAEEFINALNPETKETKKVKISTVAENPANPHYARRNIITKGAILDTELGRVRVTSKPGQHGVLHGIIVKG